MTYIVTLGRQQSKRQILSRNVDKKNVRTRVFDCHLSPHWRQMAIKNTVSILSIFDLRSPIVDSVFDCCLPDVIVGSPLQTKYMYCIYHVNNDKKRSNSRAHQK